MVEDTSGLQPASFKQKFIHEIHFHGSVSTEVSLRGRVGREGTVFHVEPPPWFFYF
jgi:hypothetical protein